jgi:hypothetical protein
MAGVPLELRSETLDPALHAPPSGFVRVGLGGALAEHGRRLRSAGPPGSGVAGGYRWRIRDQWSNTWWPQGIAVGEYRGAPLAIVSWYARPRRGRELGSRLSIIDLSEPAHPAYRHVLLVSARESDAGTVFDPVAAHAGGIAWAGDRLLVAATFDGIREFRLSDVLRTERSSPGSPGHALVLPQHAHFRPVDPGAPGRMRYSFLTVGPGAAPRSDDAIQLVAGEYRRDDAGRVARVELDGQRGSVIETHVPEVARMQGVAMVGDTWYLSSSNGAGAGDLWVGPIDGLVRRTGILPPGPEALAHWPERGELWSVSEIPRKRWIYRMALTPDERAPLR